MTQYRLIAPSHLAPGVIALSEGRQLSVPPSGVVKIEHRTVMPGAVTIEGVDPPDQVVNHTHLRELLALGFQHAPAAGGVADRPAGRFDGEMWFDTYAGKPSWWSHGAWRDALGRVT